MTHLALLTYLAGCGFIGAGIGCVVVIGAETRGKRRRDLYRREVIAREQRRAFLEANQVARNIIQIRNVTTQRMLAIATTHRRPIRSRR